MSARKPSDPREVAESLARDAGTSRSDVAPLVESKRETCSDEHSARGTAPAIEASPAMEAAPKLPSGRPRPGDTLPDSFGAGRYRVQRLLGKGGMGAVYLALDTRLNRPVAVKVPKLDDLDATQMAKVLQRFTREAQAAAALSHPHVCQVYDVDQQDGVPFLAMEFIEGSSLIELTKARAPARRVAELVWKIAQGVAAAHAKGIVHRDLKPANIMLQGLGVRGQGLEEATSPTPNPQPLNPKIMDFGLAKLLDGRENKLTRSGALLGTPTYMPKEQVLGESHLIGAWTDVYSLGVIFYELLTGQLPFDGHTLPQVIGRILSATPIPPREIRPDIDPDFEAICLRAIGREIGDRYATMHDFAAALAESLGQTREEISPTPPGLPRRSPRSVADVSDRAALPNRADAHQPAKRGNLPDKQGGVVVPREGVFVPSIAPELAATVKPPPITASANCPWCSEPLGEIESRRFEPIECGACQNVWLLSEDATKWNPAPKSDAANQPRDVADDRAVRGSPDPAPIPDRSPASRAVSSDAAIISKARSPETFGPTSGGVRSPAPSASRNTEPRPSGSGESQPLPDGRGSANVWQQHRRTIIAVSAALCVLIGLAIAFRSHGSSNNDSRVADQSSTNNATATPPTADAKTLDMQPADTSVAELSKVADAQPMPLDDAALEKLIDALSNGTDRQKLQAVQDLGNAGPRAASALPALIVLLSSTNEPIVEATMRTLGRVGPPAQEAVPALVTVLDKSGAKWELARNSVVTLGQIARHPNECVPALVNALRHSDDLIRAMAIESLLNFGDDGIPDFLAAWGKLDPLIHRETFRIYVEGSKGKLPIAVLLEALSDSDVDVRRGAAEALDKNGIGKEAVPALLAALDHLDKRVRDRATEALDKIGNEAVSAMIVALNHSDKRVRGRAAEALGKIGPDAKEVVPALIATLKDSDDSVRSCAAEALGKIGPDAKEAVPALIAALKDTDGYVRYKAVDALGKLGSDAKEAVPALIAALKDSDDFVRFFAGHALAEIGPDAKEAVPALIAALKDSDDPVCRSAAYALGKIGPDAKPALPELRKLVNDQDYLVGSAAQKAIQQIEK